MKIRTFIVPDDFGSTIKAAWPVSMRKEEFPDGAFGEPQSAVGT
jgi:hypothetical protein